LVRCPGLQAGVLVKQKCVERASQVLGWREMKVELALAEGQP